MAASNAGKVLFRCLHGHLLKIHHGYKLQTQRLLLGHLQVTTSTLNVRYFSPDSRSSSDSSSSSSDSESSSDSDIDSDTDKSAEDFLAKARKPPGYMAWEPVDDVYMLRHYPPRILTLDEALARLRTKSEWAWCRKKGKYSDRIVQLAVKLDMALDKKKKVENFKSIVMLPHHFREDRKVLCFAKGSDVDLAKQSGAEIAGGSELIPDILSRKFKHIDHYVSAPDIMREIVPLKAKLRKKFPNTKRKSVGRDLPPMIELYRKGQVYKCHKEGVSVNVGKLSQSNEQIAENIETMIQAICSQKPLRYGPFITKAVVTAFLLDSHRIKYEHWLPTEEDNYEDEVEVKI